MEFNFTGTTQIRPGEHEAWLDGKRVATFNSEGAAKAGIDVEKRRNKRRRQSSDLTETIPT